MKIDIPRPGMGSPSVVPGARAGVAVRPTVDAGGGLSLALGQLVRGQVVGATPDGGVLLLVDGQALEARSEIPLQPGSDLWLEVRRTDPLWLGVADRKGTVQEFLRQYCVDPAAIGRGLRLLGEAAALGMEESLPAGFAEMGRALADSAVGPENAPERLLRLLGLLGRSAPERGGEARQGGLAELATVLARHGEGLGKGEQATLQRLGVLLDLQAELTALPSPANQGALLLAPCLFSMDSGWGQWLLSMDRPTGAGEAEPGCTISFFLEMSRMGEVQFQVRIKGKALHAEMVAESEEVQRYVEGMGQELIGLLARLGFGPVSFSCRQAKTSGLLASLKACLEEAVGSEGVRIVDLRA